MEDTGSQQGATIATDSPVAEVTPWHSDEQREFVENKGWKDGSSAIQSYIDLEKSQGGKVKIPTETSTPEETSSFYKSIGVPEGPEGYEIKDVPGNITRDEGAELVLRGVAFSNNIPKVAFEAVVKAFYDGESARLVESRAEGETALKEAWSKPGEYDANIEIMTRAVDEFFSEESKAIFNSTGIGNLPSIVKDLHNIGLKMLSDTLIKGSTPPGENPDDKNYQPASPNSPEMYRNGDSDACKKAREYFIARGHIY